MMPIVIPCAIKWLRKRHLEGFQSLRGEKVAVVANAGEVQLLLGRRRGCCRWCRWRRVSRYGCHKVDAWVVTRGATAVTGERKGCCQGKKKLSSGRLLPMSIDDTATTKKEEGGLAVEGEERKSVVTARGTANKDLYVVQLLEQKIA
ncbi:hypothetical protein SADUNF_Sadunf06G0201300 [Salix dunnii]|uniref:Uncharacterized protein n=1 Tax=Salix dunnii TaxID=1413687 RepID=A0A835K8C8_9ROSI|nr:hypothetical protein SADUNF_Sadunf06G0201300 [Salix dunnii]